MKEEVLNSLKREVQERISFFSKKEMSFHLKSFSQPRLSLEDRRLFRQFLVQTIRSQKAYKEKDPLELKELLKPGTPPYHPRIAVSLSHCKNLAVFLFLFQKESDLKESKRVCIGFDMEERKRVSAKLISRVSSPQEIKESPEPSFLWTAKEASLKCFYKGEKNRLVHDFFISHWKPLEKFKDTWTFKSQFQNQEFSGLAFHRESLSFSYVESILSQG